MEKTTEEKIKILDRNEAIMYARNRAENRDYSEMLTRIVIRNWEYCITELYKEGLAIVRRNLED